MRVRLAFFVFVCVFLLFVVGCSNKNGTKTLPSLDDDVSTDDDTADDDDNDDNDDNDNDDNDTVDDDATPTHDGTKSPIVLMHGFFGWGELGPLSYFAGVAADLTAQGYDVYEPAVSPINSMEVRAGQWVTAIEEHFGKGTKVNMIAHSQGGLDARYMISTLGWGDRVGALVMVSTPNRGTVLADIVDGLLPGVDQSLINSILNIFGMSYEGISELSHEYVNNTFNPANPDDPRVAYYSYEVDAANNCFLLLQPTHYIISLFDGANDGVIDDGSANWDTMLGVESADHWSIIGQPVGFANFDQVVFYRGIASYLRDHGF
jgi:triacylglycerol lipase